MGKWTDNLDTLATSLQAIVPGTGPYIEGAKALVGLVDDIIDIPGVGDDEVAELESRRPQYEAMVLGKLDATADRLKG